MSLGRILCVLRGSFRCLTYLFSFQEVLLNSMNRCSPCGNITLDLFVLSHADRAFWKTTQVDRWPLLTRLPSSGIYINARTTLPYSGRHTCSAARGLLVLIRRLNSTHARMLLLTSPWDHHWTVPKGRYCMGKHVAVRPLSPARDSRWFVESSTEQCIPCILIEVNFSEFFISRMSHLKLPGLLCHIRFLAYNATQRSTTTGCFSTISGTCRNGVRSCVMCSSPTSFPGKSCPSVMP